MIRRIVKMTFKEDEVEAFKALFDETCNRIRSFDGCESLELVQSDEDSRIFFTISTWQTAAALDSYRHSDLFKSTWKLTKAKFAGKPAAWSTHTIKILS